MEGLAVELSEYGNRRVLIVDDQPDIHRDFTEMLRPSLMDASLDASLHDMSTFFMCEPASGSPLPDFELLHAADGEEACGIVQTARAAGRPVAVAYVDVRMPPGIDGIETARRMRESDADIEVVIMTAYTDKPLSEIIHGMPSLHKLLYIRKPFSHEEIQQITLSLVGKWNIEQALVEQHRLLAAGHQRLEAVLDATEDAMAMYDAGGRLVFANRGYEKLFGLSEDELKAASPEALTARLSERFHQPGLPSLEGRVLLEGNEAGNAPQRLFYHFSVPVRDGRLLVFRDVSRDIEVERVKAEMQHLRSELEMIPPFQGIVGNSPGMRQVYALMERAVESDITVLIRGESGTGKEMIAKSFHFHGPRRRGPFVAVNCAAIPEGLIESELFGHERGAFTGANQRRIGAFEQARGGTIFMDEIGDMPLALQSKLLRVLQEREFQRVGGTSSIHIDARVIAATNKDMEMAIEAGEFRRDLYYRLAVFPMVIPPLRERREDIPLLANHFLEKHAERAGNTVGGISTAALCSLLLYDWPGNVRELENAIERAVLLETTKSLKAHNLPPEIASTVAPPDFHTRSTAIVPLAEVERLAISDALGLLANNVGEAARALRINRATLYRKLKKYGLTANC